MRAAPRAGAGDDVGPAIAVDIAGSQINAAAETGAVGIEAANRSGKLRSRASAEDPHVRSAAGAGSRDDIGHAVAIYIARRHANAAAKIASVSEEASQLGAVDPANRPNVRPTARIGADDDVGPAV